MHTQLGPAFKGTVFSSFEGSLSPAVKNLLDNCFLKSPFNPAASSIARSRICLTSGIQEGQEDNGGGSVGLAYPTFDLMSTLPGDILTRMVSRFLFDEVQLSEIPYIHKYALLSLISFFRDVKKGKMLGKFERMPWKLF